MVSRIRASDPSGLNKGRGSKFRVGSWIQPETPKEDRRTHRPKHNKDKYIILKTLNDKRFLFVFESPIWKDHFLFCVIFYNLWKNNIQLTMEKNII